MENVLAFFYYIQSLHLLSQRLRGSSRNHFPTHSVSYITHFLTGLLDEDTTSPHRFGELRQVHSHSIGKVIHYWPQARKCEDGYQSKGKLEKKEQRSDRATGNPYITWHVSTRETHTLPHLPHEKLLLSSQHVHVLR